MKAIKIFAVISVLAVVTFFSLNHWLNEDQQHSDMPALRLTSAQQNVYPIPENMVSLILSFDNVVINTQEFGDRVLSQKGVTQLTVGKNKKVFRILFDPGYTSHAQLLSDLYSQIDDPTLFTK